MKRKFLVSKPSAFVEGLKDTLAFPYEGWDKLPIELGKAYYFCQSGCELGLEKYRGTTAWRDRRAVPIRELRAKFYAVSATLTLLKEDVGDNVEVMKGCTVGRKIMVYRIKMGGPENEQQ